MKNITLRTIQEVTKGRLFGGKDVMDIEISGIVSDSRKVRDDCLFLCIKGEKFDGHDFAQKVIHDGALAVLSEKKLDITGPYILVDSVLEATQAIAEYYRRSLNIKVVAVTGSVGKTSTKEFIAGILKKRFRVHKTKGNFNNQWGVPFTIFEMNESYDVSVMELGISDFGEMDSLARMARPDIVVMTNIGQSHLEFFKTRDGILKAKSEIFNYLEPDATVILNADDDKLATIVDAHGVSPDWYGIRMKSNINAERIVEKGFEGSEFDIVIRDRGGRMAIHVKLPVPGKHQIYNALAATLVAMKMGIPVLVIKEAIESLQGVEGRDNIINTGHLTILDECYNASPSSMESSLDVLKKVEGRKVAILGDMFELGEDSDKYHFQLGQYAGKAGIDVIVCVGANSEKTFMGAKLTTDNRVEYCRTLDDALRMLPYVLKEGDTVLVKASNSMHFNQIVKQLSGAES